MPAWRRPPSLSKVTAFATLPGINDVFERSRRTPTPAGLTPAVESVTVPLDRGIELSVVLRSDR
jgi:hypothetical protein